MSKQEQGYWNCAHAKTGLDGDHYLCRKWGNLYSEYDGSACENCESWTDQEPKRCPLCGAKVIE